MCCYNLAHIFSYFFQDHFLCPIMYFVFTSAPNRTPFATPWMSLKSRITFNDYPFGALQTIPSSPPPIMRYFQYIPILEISFRRTIYLLKSHRDTPKYTSRTKSCLSNVPCPNTRLSYTPIPVSVR